MKEMSLECYFSNSVQGEIKRNEAESRDANEKAVSTIHVQCDENNYWKYSSERGESESNKLKLF